MIRKYVSRLLALFLVLSMVVLCVPVRAQALDITRPEGYTDEEWEEYLRSLRLLAEEELAVQAGDISSTATSSSGVEVPLTAPAAGTIPKQSVTVAVPVEDTANVTGDTAVTDGTVVIPPAEEGGEASAVDATITERYDVEAEVSKVEITNGQISDIEYQVSMDKISTATEKKAEDDGVEPYETVETVKNVDVQQNQAAVANGTPAPQYNVKLTVNGMQDAPTRVEHRYRESADGEEKVEYYYNASNGIDETDTSKKYFSTSGFEAPLDASESTTLKEKVISLWTGFLGIFHITNDAFENTETHTVSSSLNGAVNSAQPGDTVEMLRDYDTITTAGLNKSVTVDLNGHTYTNGSTGPAMNVTGSDVTVENGTIVSGGTGVEVGSTNKRFSLKNLFVKSNAGKKSNTETAGLRVNASGNTTTVENATIDGSNSGCGIRYTGGSSKSILNLKNADVVGGTGVALSDASANISGSYVAGNGKSGTGAAIEVEQSGTTNSVVISSGLFDSAKAVENICATSKNAVDSVIIKGGRFTSPDDLYCYISRGHALISHNDGSTFVYEVVGTDYTPTRDGHRFLGYTDGKGNAITLAQAYRSGIVAYAQWKAIPDEPVEEAPLIRVKTDRKGGTCRVSYRGDTAYVTAKDADGEYLPISEVTVSSVKKLQEQDIETLEIQLDADVTLVLDVEKAEKNGLADAIAVTLEKGTLLITSGEDTAIELDIAALKTAGTPVELQLVEGALCVTLGERDPLTIDLTEALKSGERIVVKLEDDTLKLYDKYNRPMEAQ